MKIYLAGKVPKGKKKVKNFKNWRIDYSEVIKKYFDTEFIDPFDRTADESDFFGVFGFDCKLIKNSDIVIVNAENQMGVGTSQEMVIAKYFNKPIVTVLPKDTYHRRKNIQIKDSFIEDWIHPFVFSMSDFIIEDISEIKLVKENLKNKKIKGISVIDESINYYNGK
ncbi:MAG: hypothetical protein PF572_02065 [Patescibacteria group bacterium]|jgi:nucleoside 2-deoxyribosyltransferase|nr:hypothetical protein [Patescibacteria group bacterium]